MVTLANGFAAGGYDVDLVLCNPQGAYADEVGQKVRIVNLRASRVSTSLPALVRYIRAERPKAMLSALNHVNIVAIAARFLSRVPFRLVVSERNAIGRSPGEPRWGKGGAIISLMRWSYPFADGIIAVSEGTADDLSRTIDLPRERISVVYNPVVGPTLEQLKECPLAHPWLAPGEPPLLLAVGRLTKQKDYPTLIDAFARVRASRPARLMILGEGECRKELEELAERLQVNRDVSMPGFVSNPFAWMRRASLFVLSSAWEGLPGVLVQAMACGVPVVSTDCPSGPAEILEDGRWGRLVPVGDAEALATAILDTLDEPHHPDVATRAQFFNLPQALYGYAKALGLESRAS